MPSAKTQRRGLSLMEVILAIAILGGALATIGELIRIGARNAAITRDLTTAQLYCESKMNEAASGVIDLENLETETLDEEGEWMCVITTEALDQQQLIAVNVTVGQNPDEFARPVSFSMTRWIIDPAYVAECAALDAQLKAEAKQRVANAAQSASSTGDAGAAGDAGGAQASGAQTGGGFGGVGGQMAFPVVDQGGGFPGGGQGGPGSGQGGPGGPGGRDGDGGPGGGRGGGDRGGPGGGGFGGGDFGGGQRAPGGQGGPGGQRGGQGGRGGGGRGR